MYRWRSVTFGSWFGWPHMGNALSIQLDGWTEQSVPPWGTREIFEILTAVNVNTAAFWDVTSCNLEHWELHFEEISCRSLLQGVPKLKFLPGCMASRHRNSNFHWWEFIGLTQITYFWNQNRLWRNQSSNKQERIVWMLSLRGCKIAVAYGDRCAKWMSRIFFQNLYVYTKKNLFPFRHFQLKVILFIVLCKPRHIAVKFLAFSAPLRPIGPWALSDISTLPETMHLAVTQLGCDCNHPPHLLPSSRMTGVLCLFRPVVTFQKVSGFDVSDCP